MYYIGSITISLLSIYRKVFNIEEYNNTVRKDLIGEEKN